MQVITLKKNQKIIKVQRACNLQLQDPHRYRILERDSHFRKEADGWYRVSRVYRRVIDRQTGQLLAEELVLDNHSRVMYDPALISPDQIRQDL